MTPPRTSIMADPAASYWLKDAIRASQSRDMLDALHDADTLVRVLRAEYADMMSAIAARAA